MTSTARGLRLFKAIEMASKIRPNSFDSYIFNKVKITSISDGRIKGWFPVDPVMCNLGGLLHGGYVASLIDVMGFYAQLSNPGGRISLTTAMSVNYTAPVLEGNKVIVETKSLRIGKGHTSAIETCLYDERGVLIAKGMNSFVALSDDHQDLLKYLVNFDVYED